MNEMKRTASTQIMRALLQSFFRPVYNVADHPFSEPSPGRLFSNRQPVVDRPEVLDLFIAELVHAYSQSLAFHTLDGSLVDVLVNSLIPLDHEPDSGLRNR